MDKRITIPVAICKTVGNVMGPFIYNHRQIQKLFSRSGAPGPSPCPGSNCKDEIIEWLYQVNRDQNVVPLQVLGAVLEDFMEVDEDSKRDEQVQGRGKISKALSLYRLAYAQGGFIIPMPQVEQRVKEEQVVDQKDSEATGDPRKKVSEATGDPRKVFVIHGRNIPAVNAMVLFLRSIKLDVLDFDTLSARCGGSEFIGNIIRRGMEECRGIVALFTPDEIAALDPRLGSAHDNAEEKQRYQARPNVIFEAGMAMGIDEKRTILVTLGADVKLFSDAAGRHTVRLNNTPAKREALIKRLRGMGCAVDTDSGGWHNHELAGDFEACIKAPTEMPTDIWGQRKS